MSALDAAAVAAVVEAARAGRQALVEHSVPPTVLGTDGEIRARAALLPKGWIRGIDGAVGVTSAYGAELGAVLPADRSAPTVTRLYHVQRSPDLRPLTDSVYDPLEAAWSREEPWVERDAGFFLSTEGAVTPAHADRHHNLLLQLSGSKTVGICLPGTRAHARAVARSVPSLRVEQMPPGSTEIVLEAGHALYLPPYSLHWVRSTERSVALSCGWSSAATLRAGRVHVANGALLHRRVPVSVPGGWSDPLRLAALRIAERRRAR